MQFSPIPNGSCLIKNKKGGRKPADLYSFDGFVWAKSSGWFYRINKSDPQYSDFTIEAKWDKMGRMIT